jgi:tetratricopeptide (TPR) repeat protein
MDTRLATLPRIGAAFSFLIYVAVAISLVIRRGPLGLIGFAIATPAILFATELSTVRFQEPFVLYRSYLWMFTLPAAIMPILALTPRLAVARAFALALALALVASAMIAMTFATKNRIETFASSTTLWSDAIRKYGDHGHFGGWRGYYNRGLNELQTGRTAHAIADFSSAIELAPKRHDLYRIRALVFAARNDPASASSDLDRALALRPNDSTTRAARCAFKYQLRRLNDAATECEAALRLNPNEPTARARLMEISTYRTRLKNELDTISARIRQKPDGAQDDYLRLARIYDALESPQEATKALERGCRVHDAFACAELRARQAVPPTNQTTTPETMPR